MNEFLEHFGLQEPPFGIVADRRFIYFGDEHHAVNSSLYRAVLEESGVSAVIGDAGVGKSTLLDHLVGRLRDRAVSCWLAQSFRSRRKLLHAVLSELDLDSRDDGPPRRHARLQLFVEQQREQGRRVLLLFDEAHTLPLEALKEIAVLANLRTSRGRLLDIVLAGQSSLIEVFESPGLGSLREATRVVARLYPLSARSAAEYVQHRLQMAGREEPLFSPQALRAIIRISGGVPRRINQLSIRAMQRAHADGQAMVEEDRVLQAATDLQWYQQAAAWTTEEHPPGKAPRPPRPAHGKPDSENPRSLKAAAGAAGGSVDGSVKWDLVPLDPSTHPLRSASRERSADAAGLRSADSAGPERPSAKPNVSEDGTDEPSGERKAR